MTRAWSIGLLLAGLAGPRPALQEEDVYIDVLRKEYLERMRRCEEAKDWRGLFDHYVHARQRYAGKVVPLDASPNPARFVGLPEHLLERFCRLPKEAYQYYRIEYDGRACDAFGRARERGHRQALEEAANEYFFSSATDEVLDQLAAQALEEGRVEEAFSYWYRLIRHYPDSDIPSAVVAARMANVAVLMGDEELLENVLRLVRTRDLQGQVSVGGRAVSLAAYLQGLHVRRPPRPVPLPRPPYVLEGAEPPQIQTASPGARGALKRWTYDFAADPQDPSPQASSRTSAEVRRPGNAAPVPPLEYHIFPAHARIQGRDYVIATDGTRVIAFDPSKVRGSSTTAGVYWKSPYGRRRLIAQRGETTFTPPYIGVTVDGEFAYAAAYSENRSQANVQGIPDFFTGTTAIKCFHIPTGKLVWDTDQPPLLDQLRNLGPRREDRFSERNFAFSSPFLVRGDRLFAGICTAPAGEQESWVLCLDKRTGRPLWSRFLASITGNPFAEARGGFPICYQTLLAERGGVVYAQTNRGVVAALDRVTGNILWLTRYRKSGGPPRGPRGAVNPGMIRPADWPVLWKNLVMALPQDHDDLLAFDALTGMPVDLPPVRTNFDNFQWRNMSRLLGVVETIGKKGEPVDWLVVAGSSSHVINLKELPKALQAFPLSFSNASRTGRGMLADGLAYLSVQEAASGQGPGLGVYDSATWKALRNTSWAEPGEGGNLLVAGEHMVVTTNTISVYNDFESLTREYRHRLRLSPPDAAAFLEYGEVLRENGKLEEAAEAYSGFVGAAEGDPRFEASVRKVKKDLHAIHVARGHEAAAAGDHSKALQHYARALEFAGDEKTAAETTRRMAETQKTLGHGRDAVNLYQEIIERFRDQYRRESEKVEKLWRHAWNEIESITKTAPEAYADVERRAADALRQARGKGIDALREVMDRFPNSRSAREAWEAIWETLHKEGRWDKLRALSNELLERFKSSLDWEPYRKFLELLEKAGDLRRCQLELRRFGERFGDLRIPESGGEVYVKEYVARRVRELEAKIQAAEAPLKGALRKVGEMEAPKSGTDPHASQRRLVPLRPMGIEPPGFARHRELFARGSSVELWDLREKRRLWGTPHPGGYLGADFASGEAGVVVTSVKPGSPADRAGIRPGDLLLSLDGRDIRAEILTDLLAARAPGKAAALQVRSQGRDRAVTVELAAWPSELRPDIVGSAFTQDYALAVAWEDGAASLDLETGLPQWAFRALRDGFQVRGFHATDRRLYLYEGRPPDRDRDADVLRQRGQEPPALEEEEAYDRLLCLNDFTGEVAWARAFDFDPGYVAHATPVAFHGKYLSEHAVVVQETVKGGNRQVHLLVLAPEDGAEILKMEMSSENLVYAVDEDAGMLYYIDPAGKPDERVLRSRPIPPDRKGARPIEVRLQRYVAPQQSTLVLAANRDFVCVLAPPTKPEAAYRIWVFRANGEQFRKIALPGERTLPSDLERNWPVWLGADGTLFVYNVPREDSSASVATRAFLTAFRVGAKDPADVLAWDAPAPTFGTGRTWWLDASSGAYLVLGSPQAALPGQQALGPLAVVYDLEAEGRLHMEYRDLAWTPNASGPPQPPVCFWRGRLYAATRQGLQVYAP